MLPCDGFGFRRKTWCADCYGAVCADCLAFGRQLFDPGDILFLASPPTLYRDEELRCPGSRADARVDLAQPTSNSTFDAVRGLYDHPGRAGVGLDPRNQTLELAPFGILAAPSSHSSRPFFFAAAFRNIGKKLRCVFTLMTSLTPIVFAFLLSPPAGVITSKSGFSMIAA